MTEVRDEDLSGGRDPEIIRAEEDIARTRAAVTRSMMALHREVSRVLDWREWVARRPIHMMAIAFGIGVVVGSVKVGRRRA